MLVGKGLDIWVLLSGVGLYGQREPGKREMAALVGEEPLVIRENTDSNILNLY